ncbi:DNA mismatch repair endonuclease MutL [Compostibacter hankyongensis]|uniref:DNA mismatch repair protein MutL n=1 Tax=Compostibacter hankyongensis TaxID=1007089 RepID=A0ABP8G0L5_9BACT
MADIIQLLPDNLANQIAAGEVIQRPASAVKELLENAVDAGADQIQLFIGDAGKSLVQVVDNGCGMSETDARLCFERHATSKIRSIDDLFRIRTMGFRGEALASIAAVSQVELKTRRAEEELGVLLEVDNSIVKRQEPCQCPAGTSIAMKNLFFNIPARRNFLKSNNVEIRHITEEFIRVALAFPHISFSLNQDGQEQYHLEKGSAKQRIVALLGSAYNAKLISIRESTDYMNIYGFAGKPETAKKTRGDQFFFVNNRFIRSAYLHHAVMGAFSDMIPADTFPPYVLFIELDPAHVDINVHPTKQEIKFEDEKLIYAFVQSALKHALARFSITPALDFDLDPGIQQLPAISQPFTPEKQEDAAKGSFYQTFTRKNQAHFIEQDSNLPHWKTLYGTAASSGTPPAPGPESASPAGGELYTPAEEQPAKAPVQVHTRYILLQIKSGFILIDQQAAHERILYEQFRQAFGEAPAATQQSLFPQTLQLSPADTALLQDMLPDLRQLGYDIAPFGGQAFIIQGIPADMDPGNEQQTLEGLLEQFKHFSPGLKADKRERLIRSLARQQSVKPGKPMEGREMQNIIDRLFACSQPQVAPGGGPTYVSFPLEELGALFGR